MEHHELDALAADIRANGLREPIIRYEGLTLDGRNREMACERAGVTPHFITFDDEDPVAFVLSKNLHRRHLNESQRAMVAARLATLDRGRPVNASCEAITQPTAARLLNIGRATVQRAAIVRDKAVPELAARVERGDIPVALAAKIAANLSEEQQRELTGKPEAFLRGVIKQQSRDQREQALAGATAKASAALGTTRYNVILADPPWRFEPYSRETGMDRSADNRYPTIPTAELLDFEPMRAAPARDCVLFCWTTTPMVPDALTFITTYGFTYRSFYAWAKPGPGHGYWSHRDQVELLLVAMKGNVPAPAPGTQPPQYQIFPRGEHSEKPDAFADMIAVMFPNVPKLEMFARKKRSGWDVWGNEVEPLGDGSNVLGDQGHC
jgi:N6-adenosine-specific RNA methylase IME4